MSRICTAVGKRIIPMTISFGLTFDNQHLNQNDRQDDFFLFLLKDFAGFALVFPSKIKTIPGCAQSFQNFSEVSNIKIWLFEWFFTSFLFFYKCKLHNHEFFPDFCKSFFPDSFFTLVYGQNFSKNVSNFKTIPGWLSRNKWKYTPLVFSQIIYEHQETDYITKHKKVSRARKLLFPR